jgi:hypothetical protein
LGGTKYRDNYISYFGKIQSRVYKKLAVFPLYIFTAFLKPVGQDADNSL